MVIYTLGALLLACASFMALGYAAFKLNRAEAKLKEQDIVNRELSAALGDANHRLQHASKELDLICTERNDLHRRINEALACLTPRCAHIGRRMAEALRSEAPTGFARLSDIMPTQQTDGIKKLPSEKGISRILEGLPALPQGTVAPGPLARIATIDPRNKSCPKKTK